MMKSRASEPILFLDLDRTLYPPEQGLQEAGDRLLTAWMSERLGLPVEEVNRLRKRLWAEYGTSARGLEHEYGIPQAEVYANCIEQLLPADYVSPRPQVAQMLRDLSLTAYVCTNSTQLYCGRVLQALGLEDCFAGLITIETMQWWAKPFAQAYRAALEFVGAAPEEVVFVDDALVNVQGARDCGLGAAVLCHPQPREPWTPHIRDILELPAVLPALLPRLA